MKALVWLLVVLAGAALTSAAQVRIAQSPYPFHEVGTGGRIEPQSFVRDPAGTLYFVYLSQFTPPQYDVAIARSTTGGLTWEMTWQQGFAANPAGDFGNFEPTLAVDSKGNLHCAWTHRPLNDQNGQTIRYNRWDAATKSWGTEAATAAGASRYTRNAALAVDSKDHVYLMHAHASTGRATLFRSDQPCAADQKFTPVNPAFASTLVYQISLVVDALDQVHAAYYGTGASSYSVHHQCFTGSTWTPQTMLGNGDLCADWPIRLCADLNGNVYAFYGRDTQAAPDKTQWDPVWEVRRWDGATQTWGAAVQVYKTTRTQYRYNGLDSNHEWTISVACDENTGEVYLIYRDFDAGRYLLATWRNGDPSPGTYALLNTTGSLAPNYPDRFYSPQMRGSVYPACNRTALGLDLLHTEGDPLASPATYTLVYDALPVGSLLSVGRPQVGTTYPLDLQALGDAGLAYQVALSASGPTPGIPIDRRVVPLAPDPLFFLVLGNALPGTLKKFAGTLDAAGAGRAELVIPGNPALAGTLLHGAFATYPGAPSGIKTLSNAWRFVLVK
ncbi:MAG: hypothetical protein JXQ29_18415 [Planctomycetes bacterium]|nr:hypothetical protein [Planctomycetota bacterium]